MKDGVFLSDPPDWWSEGSKQSQREAKEGLDRMFKLAKKYKAKIAIGSDYVDNAEQKREQSYELANRLKWFTVLPRSGKEPRADHEGWKDLQKHYQLKRQL